LQNNFDKGALCDHSNINEYLSKLQRFELGSQLYKLFFTVQMQFVSTRNAHINIWSITPSKQIKTSVLSNGYYGMDGMCALKNSTGPSWPPRRRT